MAIPHIRMRLFPLLLLLVVISAYCSLSAAAQNITATLLGTVQDPSGASIPGATVSILNQATNQSFVAKTNKLGDYQIPFLQPGTYNVKASAAGFKTILRSNITLEVDSRLVLNLQLPLGSTQTVVSVVGRAPLLDTTTASLGNVLSSRSTTALPTLGRNAFDLVGVTAGVQVNPNALGGVASTGTNAAPLFVQSDISINGGRFRTNDFLLDGVSIMLPENNDFALSPIPDSVEEMKVITNSVGPQFGRSGGGVVDVVTKSGTNRWKGEAYEYVQNQRFNALNYFAGLSSQKRAPFNSSIFGGNIGGPLVKNNTFLFAAYEGTRNHSTNPGQLLTLPTMAERAGDFSQTMDSAGQPITIYNPLTTRPGPGGSGFLRDPFQNNQIPTQYMNPVALNIAKFIPAPNLPGVGPALVNNFVWSQNVFQNSDQWSVRIDHRFSDRQSLFGVVTRNTGVLGNSGPFHNAADNVLGNDVNHVINTVLNYTLTLSPTNFINLRYGLTRRFEGRTPINGPFDVTSLGFPPTIADAAQEQEFPYITFTSDSSLGASSVDIRRGNSINTFVAQDMMVHGRNTFVYGADVRLYNQTPFQAAGSGGGNYSFSPSFTQGPNPLVSGLTSGDDFASFLTGYGSGEMESTPALAIQNWYWALYFNDEIRLNKLTVNLGLRYDYTQPLTERHNRFSDFDPNAPFPISVPGLPSLQGVMQHPGQGGLPRRQTNSYWKSFGPRVGLAYELLPTLVLRAGYGIFYPPLIGATSGSSFGTSGYALTTPWVASLDGVTPLNSLSDPYPTGVLVPPTSQADLLQMGQGITVDERTNVNNSYIQQWNFSVQWQPAENWMIEASYAGNKGTRLPVGLALDQLNPTYQSLGSQLVEQVANPFFGLVSTGPLASPTVPRSTLLSPYPQYTSVSTSSPPIFLNLADSIYHSLEINVEHRFAHGVSLTVAYTKGKSISDASSRVFGVTAYVPPVQNTYDLAAERSIDEGDISQRLAISHVIDLPFGRGRELWSHAPKSWNEVIGGWSANGILTLTTGFPLALTSIGNSGVGSSTLRPDTNGKDARLSGSVRSRLNRYFNTSVFSVPPPYTFGNVSRTLPNVRAPGVSEYDFALAKTFPIRESTSLLFRWEAYNLTNTPQFGAPGTELGSSSFGVISTASGQRQMQFALKLLF